MDIHDYYRKACLVCLLLRDKGYKPVQATQSKLLPDTSAIYNHAYWAGREAIRLLKVPMGDPNSEESYREAARQLGVCEGLMVAQGHYSVAGFEDPKW